MSGNSNAESWYALTPERVREILEQIRSGPAPAPEIAGLFYRGRTHGLPGKRDAGKSLLMACVSLGILKDGGSVLWIDHEVGAQLVLRRLVELGGDEAAIAERFHLIDDARGLAPPEAIAAFAGVTLVVLDAMTGQMSRSGLDDNSAVDVDQVYDAICKPLAHKHGACVVIIDHVPHGATDRPLGSQRKSSAPDVELLLSSAVKFKPGRGGRAKITVGRDRLGRIEPGEFVLEPDNTWRIERSAGPWRPTLYMQRVSDYLRAQTEPVSRSVVERDVGGSAEYVRLAMDLLVAAGHAAATPGPRKAVLLTSVEPYPGDPVTPSAPRRDGVPRHPVSPLQGDGVDGDGVDPVSESS